MKVAVISMTTWGEKGNWLSGASLAASLSSSLPGALVELLPAEPLVPTFGEVGAAIKAATAAPDPAARFARYGEVLGRLAADYPEGFESSPARHPAAAARLAGLAERLADDPPDVVIGTKGIICRAATAALAIAGVGAPVIDYVTNHAHFDFAAHRCPAAARHLVRLVEARPYLVERCGYPAGSVRHVGYLIAARQLGRVERAPARSGGPPHVIVVSNRGGREYADLLTGLATRADGTFIAINDPELGDAAREVVDGRWEVVTDLDQGSYLDLLAGVGGGRTVLVCKASPNSIFEAVYFGIPCYLVRTGLPMEEWAAELAVREGLAVVADRAPDLQAALEREIAGDGPVDPARLADFATRHLDQEAAEQAIAAEVAEVAGG